MKILADSTKQGNSNFNILEKAFPCGGSISVGDHCVMAALDAGCARPSRPHWYSYALAKRTQSMKMFSHPCLSFLSLSASSTPLLSSSLSFSLTYHNQLSSSSPHNTNFVSPLKPFHSTA